MQIKDELLDIEGIKNSNKPLLDLFIRRTAVLTSTPEHIVDKIVKDQWRRANQVLSTGTPIGEVDFCNLGSFRMSKKKSRIRIEKLEKYQEYYNQNTFDDPKTKLAVEERMIVNDKKINDIKLKTKTNEN